MVSSQSQHSVYCGAGLGTCLQHQHPNAKTIFSHSGQIQGSMRLERCGSKPPMGASDGLVSGILTSPKAPVLNRLFWPVSVGVHQGSQAAVPGPVAVWAGAGVDPRGQNIGFLRSEWIQGSTGPERRGSEVLINGPFGLHIAGLVKGDSFIWCQAQRDRA